MCYVSIYNHFNIDKACLLRNFLVLEQHFAAFIWIFDCTVVFKNLLSAWCASLLRMGGAREFGHGLSVGNEAGSSAVQYPVPKSGSHTFLVVIICSIISCRYCRMFGATQIFSSLFCVQIHVCIRLAPPLLLAELTEPSFHMWLMVCFHLGAVLAGSRSKTTS